MVALFNLSTYILILFSLGSSLHPYPEILQYNTMILHRYQMVDKITDLNPGPMPQKFDALYVYRSCLLAPIQNIIKMS